MGIRHKGHKDFNLIRCLAIDNEENIFDENDKLDFVSWEFSSSDIGIISATKTDSHSLS